MKYSGVEWIGEIPDNWNVKAIRECLFERNEKNNQLQETTILSLSAKDGVTLYDGENHSGNKPREDLSGYKIVKENDIVANSMNILSGSVGLSKYNGVVSPVYYIYHIRNSKDNIRYFSYIFQCNEFQKNLRRLGKGILIRESEDGKLNTIRTKVPPYQLSIERIPYPDEYLQKCIVKLLDKKTKEIDSLIEIENQQIEKLKEYVESSIYEYLKKELGVSINDMSFESRTSMKKIGALSNLVTKQTGFDYSNTIKPTMLDSPNEDSLPYLQTRNFKNNYFNLNTEFYVPKSTWEQFPKLILDDETLLFSIVGASIGNVAIFPKSEKAFLGGAICRVNLVDKEYALFIKEIMLSKFGQEQINRKINSNAQGTITVQNVRDFLIPMPSKKDAIRIGLKCESKRKEVDDLIAIKEKKIDELTEYKKSLIYEYVTGKKEVC